MSSGEPRACTLDADGHARRVLEFERVLELVAAHAVTAGGRARVAALVPSAELETVQDEQILVSEATRAMDEGLETWPLDGTHAIDAALAAAARPGGRLDAIELRQVAATLDVAGRLRRFLDQHAERLSHLQAQSTRLVAHTALVAMLYAAIDEHGVVHDDASPALRSIRRALQGERTRLLARLEELLRASGAAGEGYVTLRGDRYVIPVRTESAGSVRGIVHDRSASGSTLFVEPLAVVDANNELQRLQDAERREIERILRELSAQVGAAASSASASLDTMYDVDAVRARAAWARTFGCTSPSIGAPLRLRTARHPLLEMQLRAAGGGAVPLDVDQEDVSVLVLTGPNTGGKTVALRTVGLAVLLHQAGVPIPAAADSRLPIFARVIADIGDEQSVDAAESTFSAHMRHVIGLLDAAPVPTLALLDEFMAGTDPAEGAALAQVVLRDLAKRRVTTFVTTHLGDLKLFAHTEPGIANAAMAFDPESRRPLYRLQPNVPGSSNAFAIAAGLGFPPALLEAARALRGNAAGRMEALLQSLAEETARAADTTARAAAAEAEAKRMREELAVEWAEVARRRRGAQTEARREAERLVAEARARVESVIRELRAAAASPAAIRAAHGEIAALEHAITPDPERDLPPAGSAPPKPGDRVWVRPLERDGILEAVESSGRARVRLGNITVRVPLAELIARGAATEAKSSAPAPVAAVAPASESPSTRLDLRGMERAEALEALDRFLDAMLLHNLHQAEIVHGKGTGVLRRAVQEVLTAHADVLEARLGGHGEGGSGVTIVKLRG